MSHVFNVGRIGVEFKLQYFAAKKMENPARKKNFKVIHKLF
jgi:hypothetical protein